MATRKCKRNDKVEYRDDTWTVRSAAYRDKAYRTYYELRNDEDKSQVEYVRTDKFVAYK